MYHAMPPVDYYPDDEVVPATAPEEGAGGLPSPAGPLTGPSSGGSSGAFNLTPGMGGLPSISGLSGCAVVYTASMSGP